MNAASKRGPCLGVLCGLLAILSVAACDRLVSTDTRIERAQQHLAAGYYRAAMVELKIVLEEAPDHALARSELAGLYLHLGDAESARRELDRISPGGVVPKDLLELSYRIDLAQRKFAALVDLIERDESLPPERRLTLLATAQRGLGRPDEAHRSLEAALRLAPDDPRIWLEQGLLRSAQRRPEEAMRSLDRALRLDPKLAEAALVRAEKLSELGRHEEARAALQQLVSRDMGRLSLPNRFELLVEFAQMQMAVRDLPAAEATIGRLGEQFPDAPLARVLRARFAFIKDDYRTAVTELQHVTRVAPDFMPARVQLGAALLAQGALEQAEAELSRVLARQPGELGARKLLAQVHLARGEATTAQRVLAEAVGAGSSDPQFDWLLGAALLQTGSIDEGVSHLERSAAAAPGDSGLQARLASAYLVAGRRERAREVLDSIPPDARSSAARELMVLASLEGGGDLPAARQSLEKLVARHSKDAALIGIAGVFAMRVADRETARRLMKKSLELDPEAIPVRLNMAQLEAGEGNLDAARSELQRVLEIDPMEPMAYSGLAGLAVLGGDRKEATRLLERAIAVKPGAVGPRLILAQLALLDGDGARARALLDQAVAVAVNPTDVLNVTGEIFLRAGRYDDALARFEEAARAGAPGATLNAARAQIALGQLESARRNLDSPRIRQAAPMQAGLLLVELDARQGQIERGQRRIGDLKRLGLPAAAAEELEGDLMAVGGRHESAARLYEAAAQKRPSRSLAIKRYRAAVASRATEPQSALASWLVSYPDDHLVRFLLAEHYLRAGPRDAAIAQYERLLARSASRDPIALNNLAWLYSERGDNRALALAEEAFKLAPRAPGIADTYGWVLVSRGKAADAIPILRQAARDGKRDADIRYHLAAAYVAVGDSARAREVLDELFESDEAFPSRPAAEQLRNSLLVGRR